MPIVKRRYRSLLLAALALATSAVACSRAGGDRAADVILIVVDTLRAQNLSLYGYERSTSPNLERFAKDAVTYEMAISTANWTVPAHASMFTGLLPSYHGAQRVPGDRILATPINPQARTLAEILHEHGFRTGAFIGNTTYVTGILGFNRGFEVFATRFPDNSNHAPSIVAAALAWLAENRQPAFQFLNILDPHEPYEPPPPFDTRFPGRVPALGAYLTRKVNDGEKVTPEMRAHFLSQYDGEIAFTDEALGRFFADLRKMDRYDRALIIVTSDHGELFGEHGLAGHGNATYEPLLHVPLIVKYPGNRRAGERVERRVSTLGVFATVLEATALPKPDGVQSVPFDEHHPVWVEDVDFFGASAIVGYDDHWKIVRSVNGSEEKIRLWDLAADPDETGPVADAGAAAALRERLAAFAALPRPSNAEPAPVIDPEREAQLRALGYVQ